MRAKWKMQIMVLPFPMHERDMSNISDLVIILAHEICKVAFAFLHFDVEEQSTRKMLAAKKKNLVRVRRNLHRNLEYLSSCFRAGAAKKNELNEHAYSKEKNWNIRFT